MSEHLTYETQRLVLRPVMEEDAQFILDLMNSPEFIKYIGDREVRTLEQARSYIKTKMLPQLYRLGYGNYVVIRKTDQAVMGTCGLHDREGLEGVDIGFAFLPEFYGNGYAFESASRLKEVALNQFQMKEILGITAENNTSSRRLLEKLGLCFEKMIMLPNDFQAVCLYRYSVDPK